MSIVPKSENSIAGLANRQAIIENALNPRAREAQAIELFGETYFPPESDDAIPEVDSPEIDGVDSVTVDLNVYGTPIELFRYRTILYRERARRAAIERRQLLGSLVPVGLIERKVFDILRGLATDLRRLPGLFRQRFPGLEPPVYQFLEQSLQDLLQDCERRMLSAPTEIADENASLFQPARAKRVRAA